MTYEDFKEYIKHHEQMLLPPWVLGLDYPPSMSYEKVKEIFRKRRDNPNVSTMVIEEFTELRKEPMPKFVWSINPMHDHWLKKFVDEYLKE